MQPLEGEGNRPGCTALAGRWVVEQGLRQAEGGIGFPAHSNLDHLTEEMADMERVHIHPHRSPSSRGHGHMLFFKWIISIRLYIFIFYLIY